MRFCHEVINQPEWATDERFATNVARSAHRATLMPLIEAALLRFSRAELLDRLRAAQIPCGEVFGLLDALQSDRTQEAGLLHHFDDSEAGPQAVLAPPYAMDGQRLPVRRPPPHLGQHTDEVLHELLGMAPEAVAALRAQQVL